jgi:hypothetical protein
MHFFRIFLLFLLAHWVQTERKKDVYFDSVNKPPQKKKSPKGDTPRMNDAMAR